MRGFLNSESKIQQENIMLLAIIIVVFCCMMTFGSEISLAQESYSVDGATDSSDPFRQGSNKLAFIAEWLVRFVLPIFGVGALALNIVFLFLGRFSGRYLIYSIVGALATGLISVVWEWLSGKSLIGAGITLGSGGN